MESKRQAWAIARRWTGIAGYTLLMLLLFHKNLTVPETRGIALVGFVTAMSLAVGYELSMRGRGDWALPVVLLMPAVSNTAPPLDTTGDVSFQAPWSFAGLPVVSLPCEFGDDDLPVAMQLVGTAWNEGPLLAVAKWCESVIGFERRAAEVRAGK